MMRRFFLTTVFAFCIVMTSIGMSVSASSQNVTPPSNVLILIVSWSKPAAGPVTLVLIDPNGKEITEADFFAKGIGVFRELTTPYQKAVAIINPIKKDGWKARVNSQSDLGNITVSTQVPQSDAELKSVSVTGVTNDNLLTVQYNVGSVSHDAKLAILAGKDGAKGLPLGEIKITASGSGTINVKTSSLSNGNWTVYGLLLDSGPPQEVDAHSVVVALDGKFSIQPAP